MLPVIWINNMITAGLESGEKSYEILIEHLENLERSFPDEQIPMKVKGKDAQETMSTSIIKKEEQNKKHKVEFGKGDNGLP